MKLYQNVLIGLRWKQWTIHEAFAYFSKGVARELKIAPVFFGNYYNKVLVNTFTKEWLKKDTNPAYFDIKGAKLPYTPDKPNIIAELAGFMFEDCFTILTRFNDCYDKSIVEQVDQWMKDGPYGYTDGKFDVTIKQGDVVIDAGAWIGDFSAYVALKGAQCYAFEPLKDNYDILLKTVQLNNSQIIPVQKGLGSSEGNINISVNGAGSSYIMEGDGDSGEETISITTLDKFVEENNLKKIDFIKADIEGAERDMLKGATHVLKTFAPKLAICTYHFPEDPELLEKIIKEANPDYTVKHLQHKLFAEVIK